MANRGTPRGRGKPKHGTESLSRATRNNKFAALSEQDENDSGTVCSSCDSSLPEGVNSLQCERCLTWNCLLYICANVNGPEYDVLSRPDLHWYCGNCQKPALEAVRSDKLIEDRCKEYLAAITQRIDSVENEVKAKASQEMVNKLDTEVKSIDLKVKGVASDISVLNQKCDLLSNEHAERENRKTNVIIRGLPEDDMPDEEKVKLVLSALSVTSEPKAFYRLGKPVEIANIPENERQTNQQDGIQNLVKSRPLRVVCESESVKTEIVKKSQRIRSATDLPFDKHRVFISPDQTKLERDAEIKLRKDLAKKRETDPNWKIQNGRLVKKKIPPAQVSGGPQ